MARPRVFISSTFYDLRHIRSSLEAFIERLGYEAVMSEKGRIAYDPDIPLDESCYRESSAADIFVLIIGGRYGSAASEKKLEDKPEFYNRYESITEKEYQAAISKDIPVYILVDRSVLSEYETYKKNKDNTTIEYVHVDSVNIFNLLENILSKVRNNPVHQFDNHNEIEEWLREQWAGLFRELINRRSDQKQLACLSKGIEKLSVINSSLQRYMESVISSVSTSPQVADKLIKSEKARIEAERKLIEFRNNEIVKASLMHAGLQLDQIESIFRTSSSIEDVLNKIETTSNCRIHFARDAWTTKANAINEGRALLGLNSLPVNDTKTKMKKRKTAKGKD
jgi:hypothetical protein